MVEGKQGKAVNTILCNFYRCLLPNAASKGVELHNQI